MVNPKKDYELLMRYLQGGEVKHHEAAPEQAFAEDWQPAPQSATITAAPLPAVAAKTVAEASPDLPEKKATVDAALKPALWRRRARIAIAILSGVLLLALLWNAYYFYQLSPDAIFNRLYVPLATSTTTPSSAHPGMEQYYAAGNFVAVTLQSKKQPHLSDREQLLTGLAYLHRDDYIKAIKWL